MSGPDLCRPRQQTFFKIVGLFCVVVFVLFFLFFPLFLSPCGGTLMISEEKSKTKQNKNNNQVKPCLGQTCAGRGSKPLSKSLVFVFVFFVFFFLFLSPCGGTLTGALVSKSLSTAELS
jgi:Na+/melibiose symporter-like transporter